MKRVSGIIGALFIFAAVAIAEELPAKKGGVTLEKATFAGGCFWCVDPPFRNLKGIKEVISGYTGGHKANPTYEEVSLGTTGHYEAVEITYDPKEITYAELLDVFWRNIDPTDAGGQFVDQGSQYQTAVFFHSEEQKRQAEESKKQLDQSKRFDKPIATKVIPASIFYKAEDYHQDYCRLNPVHYKFYRAGSGRDQFLDRVWGKNRKH